MALRLTLKPRLVGATVAALALTGLTAGAAVAAPVDVTYTCLPAAGAVSVTVDPGTLPTSMVAGQSVAQPTNAVIHLTQPQVQLIEGALQGKALDGTAVASAGLPFDLTLTHTVLPKPPAPVDVPAAGTSALRYVAAGSQSVDAGDFIGHLVITKNDDSTSKFDLSCTAPTDGSNHLGDIAVSKDSSKTTSGAKYAAKTKVAKVHSKSVGSTYKLPGSGGKVVFTLFKKGAKVGSAAGKANAKGVAKAVFKGKKIAKHGTYVVKVAFKGNPGLKGSNSKTSFKVS